MSEVETGQPDAEDEAMMRRAIALGREGERTPGASSIGCVIVRDGRVIGEGFNENELRCSPVAHAEMVAIERAAKAIGEPELRGATLYSTLQPCGMCTMACLWAKIARVVYGAGRGDVHEMYFESRDLDTEDLIRDAIRDDISVRGGVLARDCAALYPAPDADIPPEQRANL